MRQPTPAPWPLGTRVRYIGPGWSRDGGPEVRAGDVGVVVEVLEPIEGTGATLHRDDDGLAVIDWGSDGRSVVEFHESPRAQTALSADHPDYVNAG